MLPHDVIAHCDLLEAHQAESQLGMCTLHGCSAWCVVDLQALKMLGNKTHHTGICKMCTVSTCVVAHSMAHLLVMF